MSENNKKKRLRDFAWMALAVVGFCVAIAAAYYKSTLPDPQSADADRALREAPGGQFLASHEWLFHAIALLIVGLIIWGLYRLAHKFLDWLEKR